MTPSLMKFKKVFLALALTASMALTACGAEPEPASSKQADLDVSYKDESPEYSVYSETLYNTLLGNKPFVVFFHARWCPICIELQYKIKEELVNFPNGTKIVEVNFDKAKDLRQKYGITTQGNFVLVDESGNAQDTLLAPTVEELKAALDTTL